MHRSTRSQGFTVVEILLVLILLAIIGFTGYYVWHTQKQVNRTLNDTQKTSATSTSSHGSQDRDTVKAIKAAVFAYKDNANLGDSQFYICQHNVSYALGGAAGAQWFAQKTDGVWKVVSQGMNGHDDELKAVGLNSWEAGCTPPASFKAEN